MEKNIKLTEKQKKTVQMMQNENLLVCGNLFSLLTYEGTVCFIGQKTIDSLEKKGVVKFAGTDELEEFTFYDLTELGKSIKL